MSCCKTSRGWPCQVCHSGAIGLGVPLGSMQPKAHVQLHTLRTGLIPNGSSCSVTQEGRNTGRLVEAAGRSHSMTPCTGGAGVESLVGGACG